MTETVFDWEDSGIGNGGEVSKRLDQLKERESLTSFMTRHDVDVEVVSDGIALGSGDGSWGIFAELDDDQRERIATAWFPGGLSTTLALALRQRARDERDRALLRAARAEEQAKEAEKQLAEEIEASHRFYERLRELGDEPDWHGDKYTVGPIKELLMANGALSERAIADALGMRRADVVRALRSLDFVRFRQRGDEVVWERVPGFGEA